MPDFEDVEGTRLCCIYQPNDQFTGGAKGRYHGDTPPNSGSDVFDKAAYDVKPPHCEMFKKREQLHYEGDNKKDKWLHITSCYVEPTNDKWVFLGCDLVAKKIAKEGQSKVCKHTYSAY